MKKGKLAQNVFITLGKLKLQMNLHICLYAQGPMPRKSTRDFSRTSKFRNIHNLQEIDKTGNRKPKRFPVILVTYAI